MAHRVPFQERHTPWRGVLDLATGCYPRFLFGGSTAGVLPVFHFHQVTPEQLEPCLLYLQVNGYRTVTSDAIAQFVRRGVDPGPRAVALCFDDAWASLWTVAVPLLRRHGFAAITYVSPGRTPDADRPRPTLEDEGYTPLPADSDAFATWPELQAMRAAGVIDVQAHTFSHATMFCDRAVSGFVTPAYRPPIHLRPRLNTGAGPARYVTPDDLGCPLYGQRSRMSDALRFLEPEDARQRCLDLVRREGGAGFFDRPDGQARLHDAAGRADAGRFETPAEQRAAILEELVSARVTLSRRLSTDAVRHMCFPFSIAGRVAESLLREAGYETAFADRLFGRRAVAAGDNPYRLMRLKHQYLFCLPGQGRRTFFRIRGAIQEPVVIR